MWGRWRLLKLQLRFDGYPEHINDQLHQTQVLVWRSIEGTWDPLPTEIAEVLGDAISTPVFRVHATASTNTA